ncbi:MAG: helicase HerA-like domain-containing protein [Fimbriimonadaceae bacterium]
MSLPPLFVGLGDAPVHILPKMANRHGLVAGATGTGKTVTLQILAEQFSSIGVPVLVADVKGDLSGMAAAGGGKPKLDERAQEIGLTNYAYAATPVVFWDLFGERGHRIRATISDMGPLLLARLLGLNETQEGVLALAFKAADDNGMLLLDLKDLRAVLAWVADNAGELRKEYGNVSSASVGAIQRSLLALDEQGGEMFFGEPVLDLNDLMRISMDGRGIVNILSADKLMQTPKLYATFLLWLLSELFENLPEVGDPEKPKLVFFFDEAHLLFDEAPPALIEKVEQVVRLIRSKGVGVYFVTQNPIDIPDTVLGQLGNRFQHALRAYTPRDQRAVTSAAETFRENPKFKVADVITELGVGVALVSVLDEKGVPTVTEVTKIRPPASRLGPLTPEERTTIRGASPIGTKYDQTLDRESAYEKLRALDAQVEAATAQAEADARAAKEAVAHAKAEQAAAKERERAAKAAARARKPIESAFGSVLRSAGTQIGREVVRGLLGGILGGRRR